MRHIACATALSCLIMAIVAGIWWQRHQRSAVPASTYGALFALQRMAPQLFEATLRAPLEAALEDGILTHQELSSLDALLPPLGKPLHEALKVPAVPDPLAPVPQVDEKESDPRSRGLGERFGGAVDDLLESLQRKYRSFSAPPAPTEEPAEL